MIEYLAGFFDGEGCITIIRRKTAKRSPYFSIEVYVGQTNIEPLRLFEQAYGGRISNPRKRNKEKPLWIWSAQSKKALVLIRDLLPYLIVKKEEAL